MTARRGSRSCHFRCAVPARRGCHQSRTCPTSGRPTYGRTSSTRQATGRCGSCPSTASGCWSSRLPVGRSVSRTSGPTWTSKSPDAAAATSQRSDAGHASLPRRRRSASTSAIRSSRTTLTCSSPPAGARSRHHSVGCGSTLSITNRGPCTTPRSLSSATRL